MRKESKNDLFSKFILASKHKKLKRDINTC